MIKIWAIGALVTLLLHIEYNRFCLSTKPQEIPYEEWLEVCVVSALWFLAMFYILSMSSLGIIDRVKKILTKEIIPWGSKPYED